MRNSSDEIDYEKLMRHLTSLRVLAVMPTGRTGSDYLQSLVEDHPQVLTFNGHFAWYCQFYKCAKTVSNGAQNPIDVINEFTGLFIYKFTSRYDIQEGKNRLGSNEKSSFTINLDQFRAHAISLIAGHELTSKNWLLAIYGAYSLCLDRDIMDARIFLHHPHLETELLDFIQDFPETQVVFTVRDIRASLLSQVIHFRNYYPDTNDSEAHLFESLQMNLRGSYIVNNLKIKSTNVRLEDLPREDTLRALCDHFGIDWNPCVLKSTWAGLEWNGDSLSAKVPQKNWSPTRTDNNWKDRLSKRDQLLLRACSGRRLVELRYETKEIGKLFKYLMFFVAVFPMSLELYYLSPRYVIKSVRLRRDGLIQLFESPFFYLRRVRLCWKFLSESIEGQSLDLDWIKVQ